MKVVLFCGGYGMRLRDYSESIPKPMVRIGYRPILWHIMKYYAHFGHADFILCLGWKADVIKHYFLNYDECLSNDFVYAQGGAYVELARRDIQDWRITFVDTGMSSNIGQRLRAIEPYLEGEETFLANYADGLTDLPLPNLIDVHRRNQAVASFMSVRPAQTFHRVRFQNHGQVDSIEAVANSDVWINAGYFVLDREIFSYLRDGDDLVGEPFHRLIRRRRLFALQYHGFYGCMDTFKEKQALDDLHASGEAPWQIWNEQTAASSRLATIPPAPAPVPDAPPAHFPARGRNP